MIARLLAAAAMLAAPAAASAQAYRCSPPATPPRYGPDLPSASQPVRRMAIGGYTLAITWAPQYCHDRERDASARFQCAAGNRFGFTLHGLWVDGTGKDWPQYCRATGLLPQVLVRRQLCATPSAQLVQHEWAKHGTCMPGGTTPARYFARSGALYARLRFPDLDALSRRGATAGRVAAAIAAANPGIRPDMMVVTATKRGWLDEIWLCLDTRFRHEPCPPGKGGLAPGAPVRIWRDSR